MSKDIDPRVLRTIIGGNGDPGCWDNPDDHDDNPGGPTIYVPGFPFPQR